MKTSNDTKQNPSFGEIADARLSRRGFITGALGSMAISCLPKKNDGKGSIPSEQLQAETAFDFTSLPSKLTENHHVAEGYEVQVLLRWGDPIFPDLSPFSWKEITAEEQEKRFGFGNDFIAYFPLENTALLVVNHESTEAALMFEGEDTYVSTNREHASIEMAAHGLSVVEIEEKEGFWSVKLDSKYNRRITAQTEMRISGPAAGHKRLKTPEDPTGTVVKGTVHNCSGGKTPWGTVLTCEENILYYFEGSREGTAEEQNFARTNIGYSKPYHWSSVEERFSMAHSLHEANRFGWVVEFDPRDPESIPVKRTALGRFYHESANPILNRDGRVVIYMGDDGYFEYLYRFVSKIPYTEGGDNANILDEGELCVARFYEDGTMEWLPLAHGKEGLTEENGFSSQADVLIEARRAGDIVEATKMDRVEDVEPNPLTDKIYINCTKNGRRGIAEYEGTNPANPRNENMAGHIIELLPPDGDHSSMTMTWDFLLLAGAESMGANYGMAQAVDNQFGCPDNAAIDNKGRLWITTDGTSDCFAVADGLYAIETEGYLRGLPKRLFLAPIGAEVTGPCFTPDGKNLFLSIQHPGHEDEKGDDFVTRWPDFDSERPPRPAVVVIRRKDGGQIGG